MQLTRCIGGRKFLKAECLTGNAEIFFSFYTSIFCELCLPSPPELRPNCASPGSTTGHQTYIQPKSNKLIYRDQGNIKAKFFF